LIGDRLSILYDMYQDLIIIINTHMCVIHKYINSTTIVVVAASAATCEDRSRSIPRA